MNQDTASNEKWLDEMIDEVPAKVTGVVGIHALAELAHRLPGHEFRTFLHSAVQAAEQAVNQQRQGQGRPSGPQTATAGPRTPPRQPGQPQWEHPPTGTTQRPHGTALRQAQEQFARLKASRLAGKTGGRSGRPGIDY